MHRSYEQKNKVGVFGTRHIKVAKCVELNANVLLNYGNIIFICLLIYLLVNQTRYRTIHNTAQAGQ